MGLLRKSKHRQLTSINAKVARNINRALVLDLIRERQPISRTFISGLTGLNKSTVSHIVAGLIEEDLVVEELDRNRDIGRHPHSLRVRTGKHFVGAVYFESTKTQIAIVDIDGEIKNRIEIETKTGHPEDFVRGCITELETLRKKLRLAGFRGIGIAVAGIVDARESRVLFAPNLGWENVDVGAVVRSVVPEMQIVQVENDAKASAVAELLFGEYVIESRNLVFLSVGFGIGAGIVLDNHILSGGSHAAGEFGHMTIHEGGDLCSCGNRGCWEVYASDRATVDRYARAKGLSADQTKQVTMHEVIAAARSGEATAIQGLAKTGRYLGLGISNVIRSCDPEMIIIGGAITQAWDIAYPEIMETVSKRGFIGSGRNTTILPTSLTDCPPLLGAAALSIRRIFSGQSITN